LARSDAGSGRRPPHHPAAAEEDVERAPAPKETKGADTKPSKRTLRCRMRDHYRGNAEGSTLRLTLGCLLADTLRIQLRRVGSGKRFTFTNPGEQRLDAWMADHARVAVLPTERPWEVEQHLFGALSLPLNIRDNRHPFLAALAGIRSEAKERAKGLPAVVDAGGSRFACSELLQRQVKFRKQLR
jgi:hypothetical protein